MHYNGLSSVCVTLDITLPCLALPCLGLVWGWYWRDSCTLLAFAGIGKSCPTVPPFRVPGAGSAFGGSVLGGRRLASPILLFSAVERVVGAVLERALSLSLSLSLSGLASRNDPTQPPLYTVVEVLNRGLRSVPTSGAHNDALVSSAALGLPELLVTCRRLPHAASRDQRPETEIMIVNVIERYFRFLE
ncbi:hypothetical protein BCV70DRAFT_96211 [Testicularia cyperi]|uniref:Uncharacterized protein n=1 Tax=Testicularia cyperi TaxID=1882483 RepID=A0A317XRG3_9BASI|nr:hypothetical protein BCV70DRAFT_96211 [Testicularia cyperi]